MATRLRGEEQRRILWWPYETDIPIFPADTKNKKIHYPNWQNEDFSTYNFKERLEAGEYDNGIAIRLGKTLSGESYTFAIDLDGWKAVQAWFGEENTWKRVLNTAGKTRVEWHQDQGRIHILGSSSEPIPKMNIRIEDGLIEIRCEKQPLFVSPSIHKEGNPYSVLGTERIRKLDNLMNLKSKIDSLCGNYMSDADKRKYTEMLEDPAYATTLGIGQGRHDALKHLACVYYYRDFGEWHGLSDKQRKTRLEEWNNKLCVPKPQDELDRIWKWVVDHHKDKREEQRKKWRQEDEEKEKERSGYVDNLIEEYHFKTMKDNDEIWYYDGKEGIFIPNAEPVIKARIARDLKQMDEPITIKQMNQFIAEIQWATYTDRYIFDSNKSWIAVKNCMVNLLTGEASPFSPEFMCTNKLLVYYDDRKYEDGPFSDFFRSVEFDCPMITKFLFELMYPQDVEIFLDFWAYCLWRGYEFNFWVLLNGIGFNGKSVLFNLIEAVLGKDNVSGETLLRVSDETNRFAAAGLYGKLANVDADISAEVIFKNTGVIKKLTGNDLHTGENKFQKPFKFRNHAKLFFSCNKIPSTHDESDAFFRRIIIINLKQQFLGDKEDIHLFEKLTAEKELSEVFRELRFRLPRVLKLGIKKTTSEGIEANYEKFTIDSDLVKHFFHNAIKPKANARVIPKVDMYDHYWNFCQHFKQTPESDGSFSRKLTKNYNMVYKKHRVHGVSTWCWEDVELVYDWEKKQQEVTISQTLKDYDDGASPGV
jgi:P4 family phage/plasmid primase-like protien